MFAGLDLVVDGSKILENTISLSEAPKFSSGRSIGLWFDVISEIRRLSTGTRDFSRQEIIPPWLRAPS